MDDTEKKIARRLITEILSRGYEVSVWEGEDYAIANNVETNKIMAALASTDSDTIRVTTVDGRRVGWVLLIWGNGEDLISDSSANESIESILTAVEEAA